ncbi:MULTISPECIES: DUF565 domain-containing protein [unclassified Thermosynechococcus]|uniref:DUF565 domain-containing protein n=1 Tax=unclassified Thermosynechococcus TaxID=2622553 RepID=UPI00197CFE1B|nr:MULTISPECIES: DUF565 domain-containing protein [unclassified Thermosynechococcus]MDR5639260.1 DUF565 domain-containing protein [Thermosynechococcus sp. PP42]MDR7898358.1 DUF565 domain-containing protein [Thermosynechococcus sp. JY1332]MDR7905759.1 DUF565 domain-containing protein [Thermosynechococcus sp. JY1334]MDR7922233.1 DUF565 domain-containing protein [Thermosynechococcus sp. HY213]MDR7993579.1 DUF565 domain-containing protein [Thermosynechococcus sp. TG252]
MQQTRLNTLLDRLGAGIQEQLKNPWRRLATLSIAFLFGVFLGLAISSSAGQLGYLDIVASSIVAIIAEVISAMFYSDRWKLRQTLFGEILNALKFGLLYGLFLVAFLLGS